MSRFLSFLTASILLVPGFAQQKAFLGRWDLTVTTPKGAYPSWLEVTEKDGTLTGRVQPRAGSVRPVSDMRVEGSRLIVNLSRASANRPASRWELSVEGEKLTGQFIQGDVTAGTLTGVRAPELNRKPPKAWSKPQALFNGKDLTGWEPDNPAVNHWVARDGVLLNETKGANLKTTRKFDDFKLHIEFSCPDKGNSGLYLRGRYEVQIEYEPAGVEDKYHSMGAVYGMVPISGDVPRKPGEWESFDITLVGRKVTIVRDGVTIIDNQEIAGITGGALDSNEGEPGPFYIQGDHTGGMKFRNIKISEPRR